MSLADMMVSFGADTTGFDSGISDIRSGLSDISSSATEASLSLSGSDGLSGASDQAGGSLENLNGEMDATANKVQGGFLNGITQGAQGLLNLGKSALDTLTSLKETGLGAFDQVQHFFSLNASMEQSEVAFKTLLGSSSKAKDYLAQLWSFAATTPFQFPQLVNASQQMLAFGYSSKEIIPDLRTMGDALSAMGRTDAGSLDQIVRVFGQMHAAGKVNAGDMMQLTTLGIPGWQLLAKEMHKTVPEVQDLSRRGLLPANQAVKDLLNGMHGMYGGSMVAQSLTFNGIISTLTDNVLGAWRAFTGPMFDLAKQALIQIAALASSDAFQNFAKFMGQVVGNALGVVANILFSTVIPAFKATADMVQYNLPFFEELFGIFNEGFGDSFQIIASAIMDDLNPALKSLHINLSPLQDGFDKLKPILLDMARVSMKEVKEGALLLATAIRAVSPFMVDLADVGAKILDPILVILKEDFNVLWPVIQNETVKAFRILEDDIVLTTKYFQYLWPIIKIDVINSFNALIPVVQTTTNALQIIFGVIAGPLENAFKQTSTTIMTSFIPSLDGSTLSTNKLTNANTPLGKALQALENDFAAATSFASKFQAILSSNATVVQKLQAAIELLNPVMKLLSNQMELLTPITAKATDSMMLLAKSIIDLYTDMQDTNKVRKFSESLANEITKTGNDISGKIKSFASQMATTILPILEAVGLGLYLGFERSVDKVKSIFSTIKSVVGTQLESIIGFISAQFNTLSAIFGPTLATIKDLFLFVSPYIQALGVQVASAFRQVAAIFGGELLLEFQSFGAAIKDLDQWFNGVFALTFKEIVPHLYNFASAIISILPTLAKITVNIASLGREALPYLVKWFEMAVPPLMRLSALLLDLAGKVLVSLAPKLLQVSDGFQRTFGVLLQHLDPIIINFFDGITIAVTFFSDHWNQIWPVVVNNFSGTWDMIVGIFKMAGSILLYAFNVLCDLLSGNWSQLWDDTMNFFKGFWDGICTFLKGVWEVYLKQGFEGMNKDIADCFDALPDIADKAGIDLITAFSNGITSGMGMLGDALGGVATKVENMLGFGSPTKEGPGATSDKWAPNLVGMFSDGILAGTSKIQGAASKASLALKNGMLGTSGFIQPGYVNQNSAVGSSGVYGSVGNGSVFSASPKTANIYFEIDGKTMAQQLGQPLVDVIRLKSGRRYS